MTAKEFSAAATESGVPGLSRAIDSQVLMGLCFGFAAVATILAVILGSSPDLSGPLGPLSSSPSSLASW